MKNFIRQRAFDLGFEACGFARVSRAPGAGHYLEWLSAGHHGEMAYLSRTSSQRINPALVLPDAQTVICLAASYYMEKSAGDAVSPAALDSSSSLTGRVARYACFDDYHTVLGRRLAFLTDWIKSIGGPATRALWYVDTGPVLERDWAERAGVGFIGKHTNLISRQAGNWLFLAEILTTLSLEPDLLETNRCGTCTRCLKACPTQAIVAPFTLDARRCISYLTIELKGTIPLEFRAAIGNRIFGCDECLAVCPWNRFAQIGNLIRASARLDLAEPDLLALLRLDEIGFRQRFALTPLARLKLHRLKRNACVALGNVGTAAALPVLTPIAVGPDELIAEHARWAIERISQI